MTPSTTKASRTAEEIATNRETRARDLRGALWVAVEAFGTELQVMNTHLGLLPRERRAQAEALLGAEWLAHPECRGPVILCGDFNALPSSPVCRRLQRRLTDAQMALDRHRPRGTFFGRWPTARIDHVFVDASIRVVGIEVPYTEQARVASDHLPLIVEIKVDRTVQQDKARLSMTATV